MQRPVVGLVSWQGSCKQHELKDWFDAHTRADIGSRGKVVTRHAFLAHMTLVDLGAWRPYSTVVPYMVLAAYGTVHGET